MMMFAIDWRIMADMTSQPVTQAGRTMINAADFIRNVTTVYESAGAQILREQTANGGEVQKFIIKGIRARAAPVGPDGEDYYRCQWKVTGSPQA